MMSREKVELTGNYSWKYSVFMTGEKSTTGFYLPVVEDVDGDRRFIKHSASRFGVIATSSIGEAIMAAEGYLERVDVKRMSRLRSEDAEDDEF